MRPNADKPNTVETEFALAARKSREDAKWQNIADVHWQDLDFFLEKARREKDKDSFDTSIRVLEALKKQVMERK